MPELLPLFCLLPVSSDHQQCHQGNADHVGTGKGGPPNGVVHIVFFGFNILHGHLFPEKCIKRSTQRITRPGRSVGPVRLSSQSVAPSNPSSSAKPISQASAPRSVPMAERWSLGSRILPSKSLELGLGVIAELDHRPSRLFPTCGEFPRLP